MVSHMVSHGIQNKSDMMSMCGSLLNGSQLMHISNYFSSFKVSKLFPDFLGASTGLCGTLFPTQRPWALPNGQLWGMWIGFNRYPFATKTKQHLQPQLGLIHLPNQLEDLGSSASFPSLAGTVITCDLQVKGILNSSVILICHHPWFVMICPLIVSLVPHFSTHGLANQDSHGTITSQPKATERTNYVHAVQESHPPTACNAIPCEYLKWELPWGGFFLVLLTMQSITTALFSQRSRLPSCNFASCKNSTNVSPVELFWGMCVCPSVLPHRSWQGSTCYALILSFLCLVVRLAKSGGTKIQLAITQDRSYFCKGWWNESWQHCVPVYPACTVSVIWRTHNSERG